ncbi:MAG: HU family DNA-binding protein [Bacteroides sp.]|nr:HU family DNA-binding protein [Bacteroides sp.]
MSINYVVTKKVDKTGETPKTLYYATTKFIQKPGEGVDINQLAYELAERSSLSEGDVLSVLKQLPDRVIEHLKFGRTVHLEGIGTFMTSLTSEGYETPEEVTAEKVRVKRVCFRADKGLTYQVKKAKFMSIQLLEMKKLKQGKKQQESGTISE